MNSLKLSSFLPSVLVFLTLLSFASSATLHDEFFQCLSRKTSGDIVEDIFTPTNPLYTSILEDRIQNLRFNTSHTPKPFAIITPISASEVQVIVVCARKYNLQILIRSGGHDFEGLSYVSPVPFVVVDMINLRNITIDVENRVAWVGSGATLGELYYNIAQKSRTLAFSGGVCPTVATGGLFTGGGYGFLLRKYGLAADNVVDAILVDANGRILDRASMGEDLFWAIRGGGGNSFGVVVSWKINLLPVPAAVTLAVVQKSLEPNTIKLLNKWQYLASKLPKEVGFNVLVTKVNTTKYARFATVYLGGADSLLSLMEEKFPELGLTREDCSEVNWIQTQLFLAGFSINSSLEVLLNRTYAGLAKTKIKTDYVKEPVPEAVFNTLVKWVSNDKIEGTLYFRMVLYGGRMDEIPETSLPFPHRAGNLYMIAYDADWEERGAMSNWKHINWVRKIYAYMTPYVSKNPREVYFNYRDLDIGTNNIWGNTTVEQARIWGVKCFKDNFDKLVRVKTSSDPSNFFRNEQSIPPLSLFYNNSDFLASCAKIKNQVIQISSH